MADGKEDSEVKQPHQPLPVSLHVDFAVKIRIFIL